MLDNMDSVCACLSGCHSQESAEGPLRQKCPFKELEDLNLAMIIQVITATLGRSHVDQDHHVRGFKIAVGM